MMVMSFYKHRCLWKENWMFEYRCKKDINVLIDSMNNLSEDLGEWQTDATFGNIRYFGTLIGQEFVKDFHFGFVQVSLEFWAAG